MRELPDNTKAARVMGRLNRPSSKIATKRSDLPARSSGTALVSDGKAIVSDIDG
jgi:hypothetical protein